MDDIEELLEILIKNKNFNSHSKVLSSNIYVTGIDYVRVIELINQLVINKHT